jgi:hypothetical protein
MTTADQQMVDQEHGRVRGVVNERKASVKRRQKAQGDPVWPLLSELSDATACSL